MYIFSKEITVLNMELDLEMSAAREEEAGFRNQATIRGVTVVYDPTARLGAVEFDDFFKSGKLNISGAERNATDDIDPFYFYEVGSFTFMSYASVTYAFCCVYDSENLINDRRSGK